MLLMYTALRESKALTCPRDRGNLKPVLPMRPGAPERRTHDYRRQGTTSLFATLNTATGEVIGRCFRKHRSVEFKSLLVVINKAVPDLDIHLVLDNYGTHKTVMIHDWLARRPRYHLHFTPTARPGSTRSSAGSRRSPGSRFGVGAIAAPKRSRRLADDGVAVPELA